MGMVSATTCAAVAALGLWAGAAPDNTIYEQLIGGGVPVSQGPALRLPLPTMADGLDAAGQQSAMASIADDNHPVEALTRKSVVAPFVLKIHNAETGVGRYVDLWYVAYGPFDRITDGSYLEDRRKNVVAKKNEDGLPTRSGSLTEDELKVRSLSVLSNDDVHETYAYSSFVLFDRVFLSGTAHVLQTRKPDSVLAAMLLDPRFADDSQYPNFWQQLERDENGALKLGAKHPYAGSGGYMKITRLHEPEGAMFVEYHIVFDEPEGWFNGANLLRSKLPIIAQDHVRKFRRELQSSDPAPKP